MRPEELILYRQTEPDNVLNDMSRLMRSCQMHEMTDTAIADEDTHLNMLHDSIRYLTEMAGTYAFSGNLWHIYLTRLLVANVNAYSLQAERRGEVHGTINDIVLHDLRLFRELFTFSFSRLYDLYNVPALMLLTDYTSEPARGIGYNFRIRERIETLAKELAAADDVEEMKERLTAFYASYGVGVFGLHKAFRVRTASETGSDVRIEPIRNIRHVNLDDLVGYELAKQKLIENTEAFVDGRTANNCLLYGDAGTGKSSSIKAIANAYFDRGLRVIELYKHQTEAMPDVINAIKNRNYRFIIYMDDLSFEDFETEYKYLKAVIEGGLEKKPENILIYATSNRRHLIKESFKDKPSVLDDDIHRGDTVQEKLSLVHRFGVTIYYGAPGADEYLAIVRALAEREGIPCEDEAFEKEATRWEMTHGGRSGRTARQFIDYLKGVRYGK